MSLSPAQLKRFRQDLEARYRDLREQIGKELRRSQEDSYVELAGRVRDSAEASVADLLQDIELANIHQLAQRAEAIDRALAAIRTGDYGDCVDCGQPIDPSRLDVFPWAERCVDCQTKWEREHLTTHDTGSSL